MFRHYQKCLLVLLTLLLASASSRAAGRQFGDIEVTTQRIVNGQTHHGYFEHRFTIVNRNPSRDFEVEISLPGQASSRSGEVIRRIRRSAKINAGSIVTLPILQPALPVYGRNNAVIYVDGRNVGNVVMSGGFTHAISHYASITERTILVSRSLDSSALDGALSKGVGAVLHGGHNYSPDRALGSPDVPKGRTGVYQPEAWLPAHSGPGHHWLEVDFGTPVIPSKIRLTMSGHSDVVTRIDLFGEKGKTIVSIANTNASKRSSGRFQAFDMSTASVTQQVHRVRVQLDTHGKGSFGIDSIQLIGKTNSPFATAARASSSYSTMAHGSSRSSTPDYPKALRAEWEVSEWSDNWMAFTAFDMIALHARDLRTMPAAVLEAVWRYTEAGGILAVIGKVNVPAPWQKMVEERVSGLRRYNVGFGECLEIDVRNTRELQTGHLKEIQDSTRRSANVWDGFDNVGTANSAFPVIDDLSFSARGVSLIMLLFILAVGPLNIFLLARKNRRIWMLWTVPLISLITCGVIFTYSLFSEGITPTVRLESVTLLDHTSRRATTLGRLAYYCPLTPSGGLRFGYESEIYPIVQRGSRGTSKSIDWTQDQHLDSGWIQSRMPAHFAVRKSEITRLRVHFEKQADGRWAAQNSLGADVRKLEFKDDNDVLWMTENLSAGAKALMTKVKKSGKNERIEFLRNIYMSGRWNADARNAIRETGMAQGTYVADLDTTPFLNAGLKGKSHLRLGSVVFGIISLEELTK